MSLTNHDNTSKDTSFECHRERPASKHGASRRSLSPSLVDITNSQDGYETITVPLDCTKEDLLAMKDQCKKNPEHLKFISVRSFVIEDLPESYRDETVLGYLKTLFDVTVKIKTTYISTDRPENYHNHQLRGKPYYITYASGFVVSVYQAMWDSPTCPCRTCVTSNKPETTWWRVRIATANHVVFNTKEAKATTVEVFADDDTDGNDSVKEMEGLSVNKCNQQEDWCQFDCVTHDQQLATRLKNTRQQLKERERKMNKLHKNTEEKLAVVVSHPHGCCKLISLGRWTGRCWVYNYDKDDETCYYKYTTPTCPGSSGGPVRVWGLKGFGGHSHPHKKGPAKDESCIYNQSACSWEERP